MTVALVYDRVNKFGGAERVLQALHEIWSEAPLYTSVYDPRGASWARGWDIRTSFLQKLPWSRRNHESLGWLMPAAFESLDLSEFDVVISVTSEAAKGVITTPRQLHICYLLTPTRYLWSHAVKYQILYSRWVRPAAFVVQALLRQWDFLAAQRPDHIIAVSEHVRRRCEKYYRRESEVMYPPLMLADSTKRIADSKTISHPPSAIRHQQHFLLVSRLVPYKRIDLAIEACRKNSYQLLVIGSGKDKKRLQKLSEPTIRFIENVSDEELVEYYRGARALLMPQEEDFGLVALESQACGTPVVTYRHSGAAEVVIDGKTGSFFDHQIVDDLTRAMKRCPLPGKACTIQAARFSKTIFQNDIRKKVEKLWGVHRHS